MIFLFIDGFGLGEEKKEKNPIYAGRAETIRLILNKFKVMETDTCLGVSGLPQSATGQTAIFTGVNAAAILGRHMNGQPTITLRNIINRNNLFLELRKRNLTITNVNVYRQEYIDKMLDPKERRYRPSVTSVMTLSAGLSFRTVRDYNEGNGIYHDITGQIIKDSGYDSAVISPREAARRLYNTSRNYNFTLFEHFLTDIIGHKMNMHEAVGEIEILDEFLEEILRLFKAEEEILIITSDHGNIEDISVKTHTLNKVPTIIAGNPAKKVNIKIETLTDIMPAVLELFDNNK